jgi:hypothetical protein
MQFSLSRISSALGLALLFAVPSIQPVAAQQFNSLVKGSGPAVYFFAADGKRYAFPNAAVYQSWYPMGANITLLNADQLASMPLGGNVTFKPGVALVKVTTDPKVYAIGKGGVLRWIGSEELARSLYGMDWAKKVSDVADVFFVNYKLGAPILSVNDFDKNVEAGLVSNPGDNIAGIPSSMPVSQLPVTPSTPVIGSAEVAVRLSSSQATLNQTVTINASVTMYSAPIEKIEIFHGSASSLVGSDALAGLIQITTKAIGIHRPVNGGRHSRRTVTNTKLATTAKFACFHSQSFYAAISISFTQRCAVLVANICTERMFLNACS